MADITGNINNIKIDTITDCKFIDPKTGIEYSWIPSSIVSSSSSVDYDRRKYIYDGDLYDGRAGLRFNASGDHEYYGYRRYSNDKLFSSKISITPFMDETHPKRKHRNF